MIATLPEPILTRRQEAAGELLRRRKARSSLLDFTTYTKPDYQVNWHHRVLCEYLDKFVSGEIKRLMVFAPRQHGKSELVSRRLPAYLFGRNPDANVVACSYGFNLATRMNRDVQRIIDTKLYATLYPETRLFGKNIRTLSQDTSLRNADIFEVVNHTGTYCCAGVGGAILGTGYNWAIVDDPYKNYEEAYSPTIRQKVEDWYRNVLFTGLRNPASVLLTVTRWHRDDLAGTLLKESLDGGSTDQWTVVRLPAIAEEDSPDYDPRQPGEPLWPEFKSLADLHNIRATQHSPSIWSAMYQQDPKAQGGSEWPSDCFGPDIWFDEWPSTLYLRAIGVDPSKGRGDKWGDYSAIVMMGVDTDGTMYVDADLANDRDVMAIIDATIEWQRKFKADFVGIEADFFAEVIADIMPAKGIEAGVPLPIQKVLTQGVPKNTRIRRLSPWLMQHKIRFKGGSRSAKMLVEQLQDFPNGDHDDGPDALEMAYRQLWVAVNGTAQDGLGDRLPGMGA